MGIELFSGRRVCGKPGKSEAWTRAGELRRCFVIRVEQAWQGRCWIGRAPLDVVLPRPEGRLLGDRQSLAIDRSRGILLWQRRGQTRFGHNSNQNHAADFTGAASFAILLCNRSAVVGWARAEQCAA